MGEVKHIEQGDIFKSSMQTLVCPVNIVGTMGNGLAKAFAMQFEGLENAYKKACVNKVFDTEGFFVFQTKDGSGKKILCFPTKKHWSKPSKLEWISAGLMEVSIGYHKHGITSIAFPAIGCGKGQLDWNDVYPLIVEHLLSVDLQVEVYSPVERFW